MKMLLVGAVGILAFQMLVAGGYSLTNDLSLQENGVAMVMFCGENANLSGSGSGVLDKVPPDGYSGAWTRGRTLRSDCNVFYHRSLSYNPHSHEECIIGCEHNFLDGLLP